MDPYRYQLEWTRGTKPGTEQLQGDKTLTTLRQRKEVPSAFEANFIQESQQNPSTVSHPSDPSSSSIPARTNSYLASSTNSTSFDRTKEEPKTKLVWRSGYGRKQLIALGCQISRQSGAAYLWCDPGCSFADAARSGAIPGAALQMQRDLPPFLHVCV
ncbi:hypothetical protein AAC387_Pa05g2946 [Persea americana]